MTSYRVDVYQHGRLIFHPIPVTDFCALVDGWVTAARERGDPVPVISDRAMKARAATVAIAFDEEAFLEELERLKLDA